MPIDPKVEKLIRLKEAPPLFPKSPSGREIHISQIYRYAKRGVRGVRLEVIRTPAKCTSREAIARFFRQLSMETGSPSSESDVDRSEAAKAAAKILDATVFHRGNRKRQGGSH